MAEVTLRPSSVSVVKIPKAARTNLRLSLSTLFRVPVGLPRNAAADRPSAGAGHW